MTGMGRDATRAPWEKCANGSKIKQEHLYNAMIYNASRHCTWPGFHVSWTDAEGVRGAVVSNDAVMFQQKLRLAKSGANLAWSGQAQR